MNDNSSDNLTSIDKHFKEVQHDETSNNNNKALGKLVDDYLKGINRFESDTIDIAKNNAKNFKKVAIVTSLISIMSVGALMFIAPLKTVIPYVIKVNTDSNHVEIVSPMRNSKTTTYGEVLDKHWLSVFVVSRNTYEWETVQNNFNQIKLMSNRKVFGAYNNYITGEGSPTELFGENNVINVKILDTVILPSTSDSQVIAQVRFVRSIQNGQGDNSTGYEPTLWNSTLTFDYLAEIKTEDERRLNPLNFRVTSYREDRILNDE